MLIVSWIILKKLSKVILGKSLLLNYKLMKYIKELISLDGDMEIHQIFLKFKKKIKDYVNDLKH